MVDYFAMMILSYRSGHCKNLNCGFVYTVYLTSHARPHAHTRACTFSRCPKAPSADGLHRQARLHTLQCALWYLLYKHIRHSTHTHTCTRAFVWVCSENHEKHDDRRPWPHSRADIVVIAVMLWRGCYVLQLWFDFLKVTELRTGCCFHSLEVAQYSDRMTKHWQ